MKFKRVNDKNVRIFLNCNDKFANIFYNNGQFWSWLWQVSEKKYKIVLLKFKRLWTVKQIFFLKQKSSQLETNEAIKAEHWEITDLVDKVLPYGHLLKITRKPEARLAALAIRFERFQYEKWSPNTTQAGQCQSLDWSFIRIGQRVPDFEKRDKLDGRTYIQTNRQIWGFFI